MLNKYLNDIKSIYLRGDAREESYYSCLENLLKQFADSQKIKAAITTLPKKTEAGNPDFRIWDGKNHIIGYIEAKTLTQQNLDNIKNTEQLKRYTSTFPNVILTNFLEFILFRNGMEIERVQIGRFYHLEQLNQTPVLENEAEFFQFLEKYYSFSLPKVHSASSLAKELAKRTRFLKDEVVRIELDEAHKSNDSILGFYEAFQKYLIKGLTEEDFADLYSQTITYGLFAARTRAGDDFNRQLAFQFIPQTIGILRDVFRFISLEEPPPALQVIVDDIAEVLKVTKVNKILKKFYEEGKGKDPIIHFYETFLGAYDPKMREKRGVYYTPEPVVKYIVRAVHSILKSHFDLPDGLADDKVTLLDPAGGTLTFPAEAMKLAVQEYKSKYGDGNIQSFLRNHILKNFYSFELMMAPYAIGHLKMGFLFEELGLELRVDERFKLYLTNTLEMEALDEIHIPGLSSLSEESHLAADVKKDQPILVIMGNPPYSGISSNKNDWTEKLLKTNLDGAQSYYEVDGEPLGEKKVWLQDDYVKFLRFAQWKIQKAGFGVVAMITNHSYLDNPTFRGMRQSLTKTFDEIYILDLHGNGLKKETCPDGSKDENVFDIRQGVAIAIFVKRKSNREKKILHTDLFGLRNVKYDWLEKTEFSKVDYQQIKPVSPYYFFIKRNTQSIQNYLHWIKITDIFPNSVTGIVTARDKLAIDFTQSNLHNKISMFRNEEISDEIIRKTYKVKDNYQWKLDEQRRRFFKLENWENYFDKILYRPFDIREIYYQDNIVFRTRHELMRHMLQENIGLCFMRQFSGDMLYSQFFISKHMVDNRTFFSAKGIIQIAPLYLYPDTNSGDWLEQQQTERQPNLAPAIVEQLTANFGTVPTPEEILYYIYAVFYSNIFRVRYAEFLKIDFPRVPFTSNYKLFRQMVELGEKVANLHLLKSSELDTPISRYLGDGEDNKIDKPKYDEAEKRVYINSTKYFDNVEPEVWNYQIGGYQVLHKYLKDRKGRNMDDPRHYCRVVSALSKTIEYQKKIDDIYEDVEKEIVEFI
ncbi:MAG: type ISP restriction/modification enzyme [Candidatus Tenebribacter burtonii]|nr:type ISP restriction/modification enzyme [Candidatus Tenebribacter burtonii]